MKYTVMKCECCGKTFISDFWEGGYIDHVNNFVGNRNLYIQRGIYDMARDIVFSGNNIRPTWVIRDFINCFSPWKTNFEEMAKKTCLKKVLKYAPLKSDFVRGLVQDETIKSEISEDMYSVNNEVVYEAEYHEINEDTGEVISNESDTMSKNH